MRPAAVLALVLVLAGCGGSGKSTQTATDRPATATSSDPGRDTIEAFAAAASAGRTGVVWKLLSSAARERLGPTEAAFRTGAGGKLVASIGAFRDLRVIVSERITPEFGLVAIDGVKNGRRAVYAVPLRLEGTTWSVELGSPVKVRAIGPDPGAHERVVAQIAAAVTGPGGSGTAVMYLDGHTENPTIAGTASNATMYANFFEPALDPGRHTVVVFASDGREAGATAWDFTAGRASG